MSKKKTVITACVILVAVIVAAVIGFISWNKAGYSLYEEEIDYIELYEDGNVVGRVENVHDFITIYSNSINVRRIKYIPDESPDKFVRVELENGSMITITESKDIIGREGKIFKADIDFDAIWKLGC